MGSLFVCMCRLGGLGGGRGRGSERVMRYLKEYIDEMRICFSNYDEKRAFKYETFLEVSRP